MNKISVFKEIYNSIETPKIEIFNEDYTYYGFNNYLTSTINTDNHYFLKFKKDLNIKIQSFLQELNSVSEPNLKSYLADILYLDALLFKRNENFVNLNIEYEKVNEDDQIMKIKEDSFSFFIETQKTLLNDLKTILLNLSNGSPYNFTDEIKITIDKNIISDMHSNLLHLFDKQEHSKLLELLQGNSIDGKITFLKSSNMLADAFRRLKTHEKIHETKEKIAYWLVAYFQYIKNKKTEPFEIDYIKKCIEINSDSRCKKPIPYFREHFKFPYESSI